MALEFFKKVRKIDPYRVEQMHLFSDSLYVRVSCSLTWNNFWKCTIKEYCDSDSFELFTDSWGILRLTYSVLPGFSFRFGRSCSYFLQDAQILLGNMLYSRPVLYYYKTTKMENFLVNIRACSNFKPTSCWIGGVFYVS